MRPPTTCTLEGACIRLSNRRSAAPARLAFLARREKEDKYTAENSLPLSSDDALPDMLLDFAADPTALHEWCV